MMRSYVLPNCQDGQAIILVVVAAGVFVFGALGLAIDGAQMFAQYQMAQAAADAGAEAGIMTMFDGTSNGWSSTDLPFTCSTTDTRSPCVYASRNGFGGNTADTVTVDNPGALPGVNVSTGTIPLRVTVRRTIKTTLMKFLGPSSSTIQARGVAGIVDINSPVPILITHPTLGGAFSMSGNPIIAICGGPGRSIQVNSNSLAGAVSTNSNSKVDLSKAGPLDPGNCTTGTGADFGTFGAPSSPPFTFTPGIGRYMQPSSPIDDPLAAVPSPAKPADAPSTAPLANGVSGCPSAPNKPCNLYSPGNYPTGIGIKNETAIFKPGIYYISSGGFVGGANADMFMSQGFANDSATGQGMLIYDTGPLSSGRAATGGFNLGANGRANLVGSGCSAATNSCDPNNFYKGILAFEDHNAATQTHSLGGNGTLSLIGTLYLTNTKASMLATPSVYQTLYFHGTPGSGTDIVGEIITSALLMKGNANITMHLSPQPIYVVRQVALIK